MKNICVIGGGGGVSKLLAALAPSIIERNYTLNAIISMADNGGSTGKLREQYNVSAMGDIRKCLCALSPSSFRNAFMFRYTTGPYAGHSGGNLILAQMEMESGSFVKAVEGAKSVLQIPKNFNIIPSTLEKVTLHATLTDGTHLKGESNIDVCIFPRKPINKIWLEPRCNIYEQAFAAINTADIIVIGPGDFYTSIIPNFLVGGMRKAISQANAKKVYIGPLATKRGETDNFTAEKFVDIISEYAGKLDTVLFNSQQPTNKVKRIYESNGAILLTPQNLWTSKPFLHNPDEYPLNTAPLVAKEILAMIK